MNAKWPTILNKVSLVNYEILFRIAWRPSAGKELSSWLSVCVVLYLMQTLVFVFLSLLVYLEGCGIRLNWFLIIVFLSMKVSCAAIFIYLFIFFFVLVFVFVLFCFWYRGDNRYTCSGTEACYNFKLITKATTQPVHRVNQDLISQPAYMPNISLTI